VFDVFIVFPTAAALEPCDNANSQNPKRPFPEFDKPIATECEKANEIYEGFRRR
jgi:hypothetical protein